MKKLISCIMAGLILMGCQPEEKEVTPPTSSEVGKLCTYIVSFDNDMYHISLFYEVSEKYPIQNEEIFNVIDEMSLKYSKTGKGDVGKYPINEEMVRTECGMSHPQSVATVVNISKEDAWFLSEELKNHKFYFRVEKEGRMFDVKVENQVYSKTSHQMNNEQLFSENIDEEIFQGITLESRAIGSDDTDPVFAEVNVGKHILNGTGFLDDSSMNLDHIGEGYQYYLTLIPENDVAVSYMSLMTLVVFDKEKMGEDTYVDLSGGMLIEELQDRIIYEDQEKVIMDLNPILYGYDDFGGFVADTFYHSIDKEKLNEIYHDFMTKFISSLGGNL